MKIDGFKNFYETLRVYLLYKAIKGQFELFNVAM